MWASLACRYHHQWRSSSGVITPSIIASNHLNIVLLQDLVRSGSPPRKAMPSCQPAEDAEDPALWARTVARGQAILDHWSNRRPGRVDGGDLEADVAPVATAVGIGLAAPAQEESPHVGSASPGRGVVSIQDVFALAQARRRGGSAAVTANSTGHSDDHGPTAQAAAASTAAVACSASREVLVDSPLRGPSGGGQVAAAPVPVDTSHVPDLVGPAMESHWYNAAACFPGSSAAVTLASLPRDLDHLDLFAGGGAVCRVFGDHGHCSASFDVAVDPRCDILAEAGFFLAMEKASRVRAGGLIVAGPPCSMWTFLSSSVHQRSRADPGGNTANQKVRMSNLLVSNLAVVLQWAHDRGAHWVVEQPATSLMWSYPPMAALLTACRAVRVHTYMGAFQHRQCKPTVLVGTLPTLAMLGRKLHQVPALVRAASSQPKQAGYKRDHSGRVSGNKFLHQSAAYTEAFAVALLEAWREAPGAAGASGSGSASGRGLGGGQPGLAAGTTGMCPDSPE